jgi:hypothetical protein
MRKARAWLAQTALPLRSAVALVVQRYGGMSLMVSASQRCSVAASMMVIAPGGLMWAGRQGRGCRELARCRWCHDGRGIAGHQRPALRVVPHLPKWSWVVRAGWSRNQTDNASERHAGRSHYFPAGLPSINYPYTTQMGLPGSALGS